MLINNYFSPILFLYLLSNLQNCLSSVCRGNSGPTPYTPGTPCSQCDKGVKAAKGDMFIKFKFTDCKNNLCRECDSCSAVP